MALFLQIMLYSVREKTKKAMKIWKAELKRVVSAGRKVELQVCKRWIKRRF